jgi:hypothetical protein
VAKHLAILVHEAEIHGAGMQSDAAVKWMLLGVKSPEILCRRTGHTHGARVKLLKALCTQKELSHDPSNADPHCL